MKGSGMPLVGRSATVTLMLISACITRMPVNPQPR
jgi:hypothetical protein